MDTAIVGIILGAAIIATIIWYGNNTPPRL